MARYGKASRQVKLSLTTVCKLGTLAHNTDFSARDFREYTGQGSGAFAALVKRGVLRRTAPGRYYPTPAGWKAIERSCSIKHGSR